MPAGIGLDCSLYYNTGTFGSPTWVELTNVSNVKLDLSFQSGNGSTRATRVIKEGRTQLPLAVTGSMLADKSTGYVAFRTFFLASGTSAVVDVMCLDGDSTTNTTDGVRFEAEIHDWSRDEGDGNVVYRNFTLKPTIYGTNVIQSVLVTSGAPVFSTLA